MLGFMNTVWACVLRFTISEISWLCWAHGVQKFLLKTFASGLSESITSHHSSITDKGLASSASGSQRNLESIYGKPLSTSSPILSSSVPGVFWQAQTGSLGRLLLPTDQSCSQRSIKPMHPGYQLQKHPFKESRTLEPAWGHQSGHYHGMWNLAETRDLWCWDISSNFWCIQE